VAAAAVLLNRRLALWAAMYSLAPQKRRVQRQLRVLLLLEGAAGTPRVSGAVLCRNASFLSAFPMFVPSLSWYNDHF
jgi:hypothetical protein